MDWVIFGINHKKDKKYTRDNERSSRLEWRDSLEGF
jgi:hypothetical protein